MKNIVVVNNPANWSLELPGVEVVSARSYLSDGLYSKMRRARVFNLCRSYKYQSNGYYVSLLAEARGHRPLPGIMAIEDIKSQTMVRFVSEELDKEIQKALKHIVSDDFTLSIYFGKNLAGRYDKLSRQLFMQFQAPLLRAQFVRLNDHWNLHAISPISANEIPQDHKPFVIEVARKYFEGRRLPGVKKDDTRFDLAILRSEKESFPPSDEKAIQKFIRAAENLDFYVEVIGKEDYGRLAEFDALFIRETTSVSHHTYRFARRAAAEGLVVMDDPESILKCTNKVYLAELLNRNGIAAPKTLIVSEDNSGRIEPEIGLPCILKQPDSSFSQGVVKAENRQQLKEMLVKLFNTSDLLIAQEFLPTDYDWRVGILNGEPLFVCKYYMARKHWQIYERSKDGKTYSGKAESLPVNEAPEAVLKTALHAANLIGNGLYGVDLKQVGGKVYVIEINDNPSIDSGFEDVILKDALYNKIMKEFLRRIEVKKSPNRN
ncbi:RimK family protein [Balneolaceae bacterium YR4-1]|uniref:RimK family protein n=1 Tax=Halalkalibaculum roseum TaxID=2709311 RepID=A0A6M1SSR2_9BACT|nr:RimK family protein [Halalkalibaculum roseum]NGP75812.1 RimK family protein [Halalkalibaculum roseum]